MSLERNPSPQPVEPGPKGSVAEAASIAPLSPALRLQILSTEHWSLLASRSLAWNEVFGRTGMFLSALSGAIVALALVGREQASASRSRSLRSSSCPSSCSSA
jgi:hypothetical protein